MLLVGLCSYNHDLRDKCETLAKNTDSRKHRKCIFWTAKPETGEKLDFPEGLGTRLLLASSQLFRLSGHKTLSLSINLTH